MMKQNTFALGLAIVLAFLLISGCVKNDASAGVEGTNTLENTLKNASENTTIPVIIPPIVPKNISAIEKIEIIHFHGTHQCTSCITVGKYAEETMSTYFSNEVKSGRMSFSHINVELAENAELTKKYGVASASLWIGTYYKNGTFAKEENVNVWYKISNREEYLSYLKGVLEEKLRGA